jgi:hypothetical protein
MTDTVWNSADKDAQITLSNGDKTATINDGSNSLGVRSTNVKTSGKWYAEFNSCSFASVGTPGAVGIADASWTLGALGADNTHFAQINRNGTIQVGNHTVSQAGVSGSLNGGGIAGIALDQSNHTIWFTLNGTSWNNGGADDPATGIGGYSLAGGATTLGDAYLAGRIRWGLSGAPYDTATLNGGSSAFAYSIPSGFLKWDPSIILPPAYGTIIG